MCLKGRLPIILAHVALLQLPAKQRIHAEVWFKCLSHAKKKLPKEINVDVAPAHSCFLWFVTTVLLPLADRFASCDITGRDLTSEKDVSSLFLFPQSAITGSPGTTIWDLPIIVSTLSTRNIGSTISQTQNLLWCVYLSLFPRHHLIFICWS